MEKYIRTYYNDKKVIMKISGCHLCPLMKFDLKDSKATCRSFTNKGRGSEVDPFVINHTSKGIVNDPISIPSWCGLSTTLGDLSRCKTTYKPFVSSILVDPNDTCDDNALTLIDAERLRIVKDNNIDDFLLRLVGTPFIPDDYSLGDIADNMVDSRDEDAIEYTEICKFVKNSKSNKITDNSVDNKYAYQTPIKKQEICSLCGEDDESVDRLKNNGMCTDCWELCKNDEEKKKQAFINNFRMKRNKDFPKESFKLIKV